MEGRTKCLETGLKQLAGTASNELKPVRGEILKYPGLSLPFFHVWPDPAETVTDDSCGFLMACLMVEPIVYYCLIWGLFLVGTGNSRGCQ